MADFEDRDIDHETVQQSEQASDASESSKFDTAASSKNRSSENDNSTNSPLRRSTKMHHARSTPDLRLSCASDEPASLGTSPVVFTSLKNLDDAYTDTQRASPFSRALASPYFRRHKKESPKSQPRLRSNSRKNSFHDVVTRPPSVSSPPSVLFRSHSAQVYVHIDSEHGDEPNEKESLVKFSSAHASSGPFVADTTTADVIDEKMLSDEHAANNASASHRSDGGSASSRLSHDEKFEPNYEHSTKVIEDVNVNRHRQARDSSPKEQAPMEPLWNLLGFWRVYEPRQGELRFASHGAVASQFGSLLVDLPFIVLGAIVALSFRSNSMRSKFPRYAIVGFAF